MKYLSPIGVLTGQTEDDVLTGLVFSAEEGVEGPEGSEEVIRWLDRYFAGERPDPGALRMRPAGTDFQRRVWEKVLEIPYGETRTYGALAAQLAQELGRPMSARAVGAAVGKNPIAVVIPCHRVVGAGGRLTGYAWGTERKKWLLEFEEETK